MIMNGEHHSILSYWTYSFTERYIVYFSVLLMLSVLILVSPLLTSDRHRGIHYLQYSSGRGREIMGSQLAATLLSAFALTTLLILIFGWIFSLNGTGLFWNNYINSDFNVGVYTVFKMTYGEWVVSAVLLMYVLALSASVLAFILSRFSGNLITLIMKLIPAFAVLGFLCVKLFDRLFGMFNELYLTLRIFGAEAYVCGVLLIFAFLAVWLVLRREKRVDVM